MSATGVISSYEKRGCCRKQRGGRHEKRDGSFSPTMYFSLYVILNVVAATFNATAVISRPTLLRGIETKGRPSGDAFELLSERPLAP